MNRHFALILFVLCAANAYSKDKGPAWHKGKVVLRTGDTLICDLRLTRKVSEGLLQVTQNRLQCEILTVNEVVSFMYLDPLRNSERVFYSLQLQPESSGKPHGVFVESLYFNDRFGIVIHRTMGISEKNIQINPFKKKTIVDNYYKVDRNDGHISRLSYADALAHLESERANITSALHMQKVRLRSVNDYRAIVTVNQKIY